ncbi:hypothetical protein [Tomitella gaofuii]|uniref:hypothetical protein n=1 Tax=Tomitella gaofuii TaxID=2760083 RepID=UPI0015FA1083|nr:hypothetical protein [Tomitella gaofuii]
MDIDDFEVFPDSFCSDECEIAWHRAEERDCLEYAFMEVVFGGLMAELDHFRPVADILVTPVIIAPRSAEVREAAVEELRVLVTHLLDGMAREPWFPWMVEQADRLGDLRMPWPVFVDAALRRNDYIPELRPHGLRLVDNVRADAEVYLAALFTVQSPAT